MGRVVCKLPLAPGTMSTLFKSDERFVEAYFKTFPGFYDTCDAGIIDTEGYVHILARDDDVINVAGHRYYIISVKKCAKIQMDIVLIHIFEFSRLSTSALEEVVLKHPNIAQVAVVGLPDELKGQLPCALFVLKPSIEANIETVKKEIVQMVRKDIGAVAAFKMAIQVKDIPRTRSGKTPRKSLAELAAGQNYKVRITTYKYLVCKRIGKHRGLFFSWSKTFRVKIGTIASL